MDIPWKRWDCFAMIWVGEIHKSRFHQGEVNGDKEGSSGGKDTGS